MNVLLVASECAPLVKVGGMADIVGSLPIALSKLDINVKVAIPYYEPLLQKLPVESVHEVGTWDIKFGQSKSQLKIYSTFLSNSTVEIFLLFNKEFISNGNIYFSPDASPSPGAELERFAYFSKSIFDIFGYPNNLFTPDIVHCNDWHTGLIPQLIQNHKKFHSSNLKSIFTIHNLAYQGFSRIDVVEKTGLNILTDQTLSWDSQDNNIDFILQGIVGADFITTVSKRYSEEIQTPEFGEGLDEIIKGRAGRVSGILNGISYDIFNPLSDEMIYQKYGFTNHTDGKLANKNALQKDLGLDITNQKPLLGLVSRLAAQKGFDLVADSIDEILKMGCQVIILGTGDPFIQTRLDEISKNENYKNCFKFLPTFSESLARKIYAASDLFLIPSRYEPCGLTQMIAMKYGSVPVVRATGGLYDTVEESQTGFVFEEFSRDEMLKALERAIGRWNIPSYFDRIIKNCMLSDFSWDKSAQEYLSLYSKVKLL